MGEWKEYRLSNICDISAGGDAPNNVVKYPSKGMTVPVFSNGEKDNGLYGYTNSYKIEAPAVTISARGNVGFVCFRKENFVPIVRLITAKANEQIVTNEYLYYCLRNTRIWGDGSVQKQLTVPMISEYVISIPRKNTQNKIVSILKSLDDKIEVNRKINDNLEQQAQALFKSWLKDCEDEVTIGDLSLNITDYTKCEQKQVVLINSSDVTEGRFDHHNLSENKNLKGHFKKRFLKGDILYSQVRPRNRHWGYCTFNADNYLASTQLMVIRNKKEIIPSILLYQYLIDNNVWMDFTLRTETRSGTFPQGNYEDLSAIKVPFGADVKEITDNLENIYSLIYKNVESSRRLASLRDTLLPKLMSGELKVNEL